MKEVEVLVQVYDSKENVLKKLNQFKSIGIKETLDIYFQDPLRQNLQLRENKRLLECFRVRKKGDKCFLTYKEDHFDEKGTWLYSDEHEIQASNFEILTNIIRRLGLKELITIDNKKHTFITDKFEIVLEEVKNLGLFLEVELLKECEENEITEKKKEIQEFISFLNLNTSEELNEGKPELMLKKISKQSFSSSQK